MSTASYGPMSAQPRQDEWRRCWSRAHRYAFRFWRSEIWTADIFKAAQLCGHFSSPFAGSGAEARRPAQAGFGPGCTLRRGHAGPGVGPAHRTMRQAAFFAPKRAPCPGAARAWPRPACSLCGEVFLESLRRIRGRTPDPAGAPTDAAKPRPSMVQLRPGDLVTMDDAKRSRLGLQIVRRQRTPCRASRSGPVRGDPPRACSVPRSSRPGGPATTGTRPTRRRQTVDPRTRCRPRPQPPPWRSPIEGNAIRRPTRPTAPLRGGACGRKRPRSRNPYCINSALPSQEQITPLAGIPMVRIWPTVLEVNGTWSSSRNVLDNVSRCVFGSPKPPESLEISIVPQSDIVYICLMPYHPILRNLSPICPPVAVGTY